MSQPSTVPAAAPEAAHPKTFQFSTSLVLQESTGLRASTLPTLAKLLRTVPDSCIYYHTHHFLLQHHYLTPEPTNDFAYWVSEVLGDDRLGERLASIDVREHSSLSSLRAALADTVSGYLTQRPAVRFRFVGAGEEFFFIKSIHVVMPTPYTAATLEEFAHALRQVSIRSLYFHMFDARLRVGRSTNDFALWAGEQLGLKGLADAIARLDPYAHTLETLRAMLLALVEAQLARREVPNA
ncbi:MAG: hypothetical protein HY599_01085 [Candidatus Omnitrophica bacterium]|nr:hypothetical protein [Candidatus Omnitrophota bacterium]